MKTVFLVPNSVQSDALDRMGALRGIPTLTAIVEIYENVRVCHLMEGSHRMALCVRAGVVPIIKPVEITDRHIEFPMSNGSFRHQMEQEDDMWSVTHDGTRFSKAERYYV